MQTDSSAMRTCMASASAVECTATVRMPISRQARMMRKAISPRLAIRTFSNIRVLFSGSSAQARTAAPVGAAVAGRILFDDDQRLAEFDRLTVFDDDAGDLAAARGADRVEGL